MDKAKIKKIIIAVVAVIVAAAVIGGTIAGVVIHQKNSDQYTDKEYVNTVKEMDIFDSEYEQALPQTIIHKIIMEHFAAPLPEGKTVKKAIFIGYDGFRVDGLLNIKDNEDSAVMRIKSQGGLYHTFSGGVAGVNEQATSTAPSWASMLTGGWAEYTGIDNNGKYKNESATTFLTKLGEAGHSGSFTTSWREHTAKTYLGDTVYAIEKNLPITYTHQPDDAGTLCTVLGYVAKAAGEMKTILEDPNVIFLTLEQTDHAGHDTGFGNKYEQYVTACKEADAYGAEILNTIEARSTYDTEDWLIIISTDHGGIYTRHGQQTPQERSTWLACNKKIAITDENLKFAYKAE